VPARTVCDRGGEGFLGVGAVAQGGSDRVADRDCPAACAAAVGQWDGTGSGLIVTAAVLLVASVLMSVALLVPINSRSARWTRDNVPADWKQQIGRWDRFHYVRVGIIVAAFVLLVTGLA
jgi:uncharacterized membrane protein